MFTFTAKYWLLHGKILMKVSFDVKCARFGHNCLYFFLGCVFVIWQNNLC